MSECGTFGKKFNAEIVFQRDGIYKLITKFGTDDCNPVRSFMF